MLRKRNDKISTGSILDRTANIPSFVRMGWNWKKDIPKKQAYFLNPYYGYLGQVKYLETDESFRNRYKAMLRKIENGKTKIRQEEI